MSTELHRKKRIFKSALFWGTLGLLVVTAVELISWGALCLLNGEQYSERDLAFRLKTILAESEGPLDAPPLPDRVLRALDRPQVVHPYLGFALDPTRHWAAEDGRFGGREAAEYGFPHNAEALFQTRSQDKLIVAIFGGSVAQNFAEGAGGTELKSLLRNDPRLGNKEPVLLCAAVSGYKQPQQLMALNYLMMLGAAFDLVINIDGVNEVAHPVMDLVPKGVFPFFPYGWYWRVAPLDRQDRMVLGEIALARRQRATWASRLSGSLLRHSRAAALAWTLRDYGFQQSLSQHQAALLDQKAPSESYQTRGPGHAYPSETALFRDIAAVWQRCSVLMHTLCAGQGARYYHFLQPDQYVAGSKPYSADERAHAVSDDSPWGSAVVRGYPFLIKQGKVLQQRGVRFHDLTMLFTHEHETVYVDDCCHLNDLGNRTIAAAIARIIAEEN